MMEPRCIGAAGRWAIVLTRMNLTFLSADFRGGQIRVFLDYGTA